MKTLLLLLLFATMAHAQTVEVYNIFGKVDDANWKNPAKQIFFAGGGVGRWMTVGRIDTTSPDQKGFSPNWTYILVKYIPVVKQMPNGDYQITFTTKLTKDLP
jgi:hypothetical protein